MSLQQKIRRGFKYIARAINEYDPKLIFVGFSGGTDSLVASDIVMRYMGDMSKIFHIDTGIKLQKTQDYVIEYCDKRDWPLEIISAKEDCDIHYENIVMGNGFPTGATHIYMYSFLKERPLRVLHRKYKQERGGKILMITGIRNDESKPRSGYKNKIINHVDGVVWVNAFYWFTKQDKWDYINERDLEINPVHKKLGISGECLCGAYASNGEIDLIRLIEPETANYIESLQQKVINAGFPWKYEDNKVPNWWKELKEGQTTLYPELAGIEVEDKYQPLCVGCGKSE